MSKHIIVETIFDKKKHRQVQITRVVGNKTEEQVRAEIAVVKDRVRKSNEEFIKEREQAVLDKRAVRKDKLGDNEETLTRIDLDFVMNNLSKETGNSVFFIARSRVGKSYALCRLVLKMMQWDADLIPIFMCGNVQSEPYSILKKQVPIVQGFKPSLVETLKTVNDYMGEGRQYKWLVVLDDILDARNSTSLRNICLSFRNSLVSSIISIQSPTLVQRNVRNSSTAYFFGNCTGQECEGVMEKFLQYMPYFRKIKNKDDRVAELNILTKNHEFLVTFPLVPNDKLYQFKAS